MSSLGKCHSVSWGLYKDQAFLSAATQIHLPIWGSTATCVSSVTFLHLLKWHCANFMALEQSIYRVVPAWWWGELLPSAPSRSLGSSDHPSASPEGIAAFHTTFAITCWPTFVCCIFHHCMEYCSGLDLVAAWVPIELFSGVLLEGLFFDRHSFGKSFFFFFLLQMFGIRLTNAICLSNRSLKVQYIQWFPTVEAQQVARWLKMILIVQY